MEGALQLKQPKIEEDLLPQMPLLEPPAEGAMDVDPEQPGASVPNKRSETS